MYLTFDVGATFIKYALIDERGHMSEKNKIPTDTYAKDGVTAFVNQIKGVYDSFRKENEILGIAMGLPGQIDVDKGIVYGGGAIKYLDKAPIGELVSKACDNLPVALENDGKCAALAELWLGNAQGMKDAVVLVFGTGVGCGIIIDGKVHRGKGLSAGEVSFGISHMRREQLPGLIDGSADETLEEEYEHNKYTVGANCSTSSITYRASQILKKPYDKVSGELVYEEIAAGNRELREMMEDTYFSIAELCCNLYLALDPEVVLIGGGVSAREEFVDGIRRYVDEIRKSTPVLNSLNIEPCKFRNDSNLLGAFYNFTVKYGIKLG